MQKIYKIGRFYLLVFFTVLACYDGIKKPKNLIEQATFTHILSDIYILQTLIDEQIEDTVLKVLYYEKYKPMIFQKYGIDSLDFSKNYAFYEHNLDTLLNIHQEIIESYNNKIYKDMPSEKLVQ